MVFLRSDLVREIQKGGASSAWSTHSLDFSHLLFFGVYFFLLSIIKEANQVFKKGNHFGVRFICDLSALVWSGEVSIFLFVGLGIIFFSSFFFALNVLFQSCVFTCP